MSEFKREIKDIEKLKQQLEKNAFLKKVDEELIQTGKALVTFRNKNVTLYYKGQQFCKLPHKTRANIGDVSTTLFFSPIISNIYLPIIRSHTLTGGSKKGYLEDTYIKGTRGMCDFSSVLPEILDNMDKESDAEAFQVSQFYRFSPMIHRNSSTLVILDIEATFAETGEKSDRIDMVLYNTMEKQLLFIEVKRLSDKRLYPNPTTKEPAEIIKQMQRYRDRINLEKTQIIAQYNNVISYYNYLTGKEISCMDAKTAKDPLLGLLVVECPAMEKYNSAQASNRFKKLYADIQSNGFKMYTYGNTKNATPGTLLDIYNTFSK